MSASENVAITMLQLAGFKFGKLPNTRTAYRIFSVDDKPYLYEIAGSWHWGPRVVVDLYDLHPWEECYQRPMISIKLAQQLIEATYGN